MTNQLSHVWLKQLTIKGFRCFADANCTFDEGLTVLVGENNVGKTTLISALEVLLAALAQGQALGVNDFPDSIPGPFSIEAQLAAPPGELKAILRDTLSAPVASPETFDEWLDSVGDSVEIRFNEAHVTAQIGPLLIQDRFVSVRGPIAPTPRSWSDVSNSSPRSAGELSEILEQDTWDMGDRRVPSRIGAYLQMHFKRFEEFRQRAVPQGQSTAVESLSGSETANVLLNLRMSRSEPDRIRYDNVIATFERIFPLYKVQVVAATFGSSTPEIQFRRAGRPFQLLSQVSAGTHQVLTLLTNLIDQRGLILFIEHPESHLHPHGMRFLLGLFEDAASSNQIIITTHDAQFVLPSSPLNIRRLWSDESGRTKVSVPSGTVTEIELAQMTTALRDDLVNREVVFARSVILVEDESQQLFINAVARTLGYDLDASGISLVNCRGEGRFGPFFKILDSLAIPFVCLKDRSWGDPVRYPENRFLAFGMEIEDYLDANGLKEIHQQVIAAGRKSKPIVMQELGLQLSKVQVPRIFDTVLNTAQSLASGAGQA